MMLRSPARYDFGRCETSFNTFQSIFAGQILFIAAACLAKCSTLYLMMRLFNLSGSKANNRGKSRLYHWICMGVLAIMVAWGVGSIIGVSVDCSPDNIIRRQSESQCPSQLLRWQIITAFDIATEAMLLIVAVMIVLPVQLSPYMKFQVVLAFLFRLP
jgi:hypothetical protein